MKTHRAWFHAVLVAGIVLAVGACGVNDMALDRGAEERLAPLAADVAAAAHSSNPDGVRLALVNLENTVRELRRQDRVGEVRANAILAVAKKLEANLRLIPTTTTTTTTLPPPTEDNGPGHGHGQGKGKGHD